MDTTITLRLPDYLATAAQEQARRSRRSLEDVLIEWLDQASADTPMDALTDHRLLELAQGVWDGEKQERLSELLALNREGELTDDGQLELDALMGIYRSDLLRKAKAYSEAVNRGLLPRLS